MTVIDGMGNLQIDSDSRVSKLAANKGIALMPLLTNLVGDAWQPEAIENLAHGPAKRQDRRSEERRVGKECRSRWSAYHEKKKRKGVQVAEGETGRLDWVIDVEKCKHKH